MADITKIVLPNGDEYNFKDSGYNPDTATVDMTQSVGVDGEGKLWTAPGGKKWEFIKELTTTEEVSLITIDEDAKGNNFELTEVMAEMWIVGTPTNTSDKAGAVRINYNIAGSNPPMSISRAFRTTAENTIYSGVHIIGTNTYPGMYMFNWGNTNGGSNNFLHDYTDDGHPSVTDHTMPTYIKSLFFLGGTFGVGSVIKVFGVRR